MVGRQTADGRFAFTYDAAGRLIEATGPDSSVTYARDAAGRIVAETVDGRTLTYSYDPTGRRTGRQTPAGVVSAWSFDAVGRPVTLDAGAGHLGFEHDVAGHETRRDLGGAAWLTHEFDAAGRLTSQRMWAGGPQPAVNADPGLDGFTATVGAERVLLDRTYAYRPDGVPIEITDSLRGTRRFQADAAGRVTAVTGADWTETYAYDRFGNLAHASASGRHGVAGDLVNDRTLTRRAGRSSYEHDQAGRLIRTVRRTLDGRRHVCEYIWNADDRLTRVKLPDGTVWHYSYDPFGRRTAKYRSGPDGIAERHAFVWDGPRLAEQHSSRSDGTISTLTWDYDPGGFRPAAQTRRSMSGSTTSWARSTGACIPPFPVRLQGCSMNGSEWLARLTGIGGSAGIDAEWFSGLAGADLQSLHIDERGGSLTAAFTIAALSDEAVDKLHDTVEFFVVFWKVADLAIRGWTYEAAHTYQLDSGSGGGRSVAIGGGGSVTTFTCEDSTIEHVRTFRSGPM